MNVWHSSTDGRQKKIKMPTNTVSARTMAKSIGVLSIPAEEKDPLVYVDLIS